jgi:lysozyme family protein
MISTFALALELVLSAEGGYMDHPDDRGGPTKYGISQGAHPNVNIQELTLEDARSIYWQAYAVPIQFEALAAIDEGLAIVTFDAAVHHGPAQAIRFLQRAASLDNGGVDGVVGPKTLRAVAEWSVLDLDELMNRFHTHRLMHLTRIVTANPDQYVFLHGWIRRVVSLIQMTHTPDYSVEIQN